MDLRVNGYAMNAPERRHAWAHFFLRRMHEGAPDGKTMRMEAMTMRQKHALIPYALEEVPRPGSREICIARPPQGERIRNVTGGGHAEKAEQP